MKPENEALAKELKFDYVFGMSLDHGAERQYVAKYKDLSIRRILWTPKNRKSGNWGTGKSVFVIDGESKEYTDPEELLDVVRQRTSLTKTEP